MRRYDIEDELLDGVDTLSGGRSRFDSSIEGLRAQRLPLRSDPAVQTGRAVEADAAERIRYEGRGWKRGRQGEDMEKADEIAATVVGNRARVTGRDAVTIYSPDRGQGVATCI